LEWGTGYVTSVKPLLVTVLETPFKKARKDMTSSELHARSVQGSDLHFEEKDEDLGSQCP